MAINKAGYTRLTKRTMWAFKFGRIRCVSVGTARLFWKMIRRIQAKERFGTIGFLRDFMLINYRINCSAGGRRAEGTLSFFLIPRTSEQVR